MAPSLPMGLLLGSSPCRQLDCLRQLVVVLCERSQLQDLVEFPYVNLHNEVTAPCREGWGRNRSF